MTQRAIRSIVTFRRPFLLPGYPDELPAGTYELLAEEELLEGVSFEAWRRTATYLTVRGLGGTAGRTELRSVTQKDLEAILRPAPGRGTDGRTAQLTASEDPR